MGTARDVSGPATPVEVPAGTIRERRSTDSAEQEIRAHRYRIDSVLGEGGTSVVYAAYDTLLERDVALKELRLDRGVDSDVLLREAKVIAALRHPNVVTLHGVHMPPASAPFLVMERVVGTTLESVIAQARPDLRTSLRILRQAAAGLDAIHAAGLVHGDVKPSNLLIDEAGVVKIADFGLTPLLSTMQGGEILGTPNYIPPERAVGAVPEAALAARSDVYSFGVVAMQLLTGRLPFDAQTTPALLAAHAHEKPHKPSEVSTLSRTFDEPILRALAKSPVYRPRSCTALVEALERAALGTDRQGVPLRILVADDDPDQRLLLSQALALELRGSIIETASDGDQALEAVRARPPAIAIVDLTMPGLSGTELIAAIREAAPAAALLVVTGHGSGPEWREAKELGARRFFVKPVELDELTRAIRDAVDDDPKDRARPSLRPARTSRPAE